MNATARAWKLEAPGRPLRRHEAAVPRPGPDEALLAVSGCGVCHTDLGFLHEGIPTRHPLPLTLGHEIAATVLEAGRDAVLDDGRSLTPGQEVIVPAVLPCGDCPRCRAGRENICAAQKMPGNDLDGGFASHVCVPARSLVPVTGRPSGLNLAHLAVVADAVTTPYQALLRARVAEGDHVVLIGAGGIGIFAVQIASHLGAQVLAVDTRAARVARALEHGAVAGVALDGMGLKDARAAIRACAGEEHWPRDGWKVFEMSGTPAGQQLAFSLLGPCSTLAVVGYTPRRVEVPLSHLMAFDADAFGSWGCPPRHYPAVLDLVRDGRIRLEPFVSFHPLDDVNEVIQQVRAGSLDTRAVLVPDPKEVQG